MKQREVDDAELNIITATIDKIIGAEADVQVPKIANSDLKRLLTTSLKIINQTYVMTVEIPLVFKETFTGYFTAPVPNQQRGLIPNFQPHTIVISEKNKYALKEGSAVVHINETLTMTTADLINFQKIEMVNDCPVKIFFRHEECELIPIDFQVDQWILTPIRNLIYFQSYKKNDIVCENKRSRINITAGILEMKTGCFIDAEDKRIYNADERDYNINLNYSIDVGPMTTIDWKNTTLAAHFNIPKLTTPSQINDQDLNEDELEAQAERLPWYKKTPTIVALAIAAMLIGIVIGIKLISMSKTPQTQTERTDNDTWIRNYAADIELK